VVRSMIYLGLEINDNNDIFKNQKVIMKERAETFAKKYILGNRKILQQELISKTFYKGVALPSILMDIRS